MKKSADQIDWEKRQYYIEHGIDIDARTIEVSDIDDAFIPDAVRSIKLMEKESDKPIKVIVSSFGGCVYSGFRLYDILTQSRCKIITIAEGTVMSMGTVIYLAGDERISLPNTTFMFHEISSDGGFFSTKLSDLKTDAKETSRLFNILLDIYTEKTKRTKSWWEKETKHVDRYMDVSEAKKIGVING